MPSCSAPEPAFLKCGVNYFRCNIDLVNQTLSACVIFAEQGRRYFLHERLKVLKLITFRSLLAAIRCFACRWCGPNAYIPACVLKPATCFLLFAFFTRKRSESAHTETPSTF